MSYHYILKNKANLSDKQMWLRISDSSSSWNFGRWKKNLTS